MLIEQTCRYSVFLVSDFDRHESKEVNFLPKAILVWLVERNILVSFDTGIPFQDYRCLYISIHTYIYIYIYVYIYLYLYYLCKYEFMNFYVYQHKI